MPNLASLLRPESLDEILGNEALKSSLRSQFANENVHQALLFAGPVGTGKTTAAKIVAKHLDPDRGQDVEVINCAAEANTQYIKDLIEGAPTPSLWSPVKIYILDECHRLHDQAQSALLNIVEEAPENVYFIFCTSEPENIRKDLYSRLKRLDTEPISEVDGEVLYQAVMRALEYTPGIVLPADSKERSKLNDLIDASKPGNYRLLYQNLEKLIEITPTKNGKKQITGELIEKAVGHGLASTKEGEQNIANALLHRNIITAMSGIAWAKKDKQNPHSLIVGIYNYLRKVAISKAEKKTPDKELHALLAEIQEARMKFEVNWEFLEYLAWKRCS